MTTEYVSSEEAAAYLGVAVGTLYSYVSRGLLESVPAGPGVRRRKYRMAELAELKQRSLFRNDPDGAASAVVDYGLPILRTSISLLTDDEHCYRGVSSAELAANYSFEQVAQFLWTGELYEATGHWERPIDEAVFRKLPSTLTRTERMQAVLPILSHDDLGAYDQVANRQKQTAIRILLHLLYVSIQGQREHSFARSLQKRWRPDAPMIVERLNTLLIVVADHELNIATFTARCVASAGANAYQAAVAGLAALQGHKHLVGQVSQVKRFFEAVTRAGDPEPVIRDYLRNGQYIPGFHNPYRKLYSAVDPRVATLLDDLQECEHYTLLTETIDLCTDLTGERPRIDFMLGCSEIMMGLPEDAIFDLIAIGRTAGMLAHIFEQYACDTVIRPRAKYEPQR